MTDLLARIAAHLPNSLRPKLDRVAPQATPMESHAGATPDRSAPRADLAGMQATPQESTHSTLGQKLKAAGTATLAAVSAFPSFVSTLANSLFFAANGGVITTVSKQALKHDTFTSQTVPKISIPYVLAPGFSTSTGAYTKYVNFLTQDGANGGQTYFVKQGQFYTKGAAGLEPLPGAPPADARVFEMVWSDTRQNPGLNLPEMRANMDAITKATGVAKVDVEAYSMGGLDTRLYLESGGHQINRLLFLGVPNHGTRLADLELDASHHGLEPIAQAVGGVKPNDDLAMQWMTMSNNAHLADLNSHWSQEDAGIPTLCTGTDAVTTMGPQGWGLHPGDGTVEVSSLKMPGIPMKLIHDHVQHGELNDDGNLVPIRANFFGWGS